MARAGLRKVLCTQFPAVQTVRKVPLLFVFMISPEDPEQISTYIRYDEDCGAAAAYPASGAWASSKSSNGSAARLEVKAIEKMLLQASGREKCLQNKQFLNSNSQLTLMVISLISRILLACQASLRDFSPTAQASLWRLSSRAQPSLKDPAWVASCFSPACISFAVLRRLTNAS